MYFLSMCIRSLKFLLVGVSFLVIYLSNSCDHSNFQIKKNETVTLDKDNRFGLQTSISVQPGDRVDIYVKRKGSNVAEVVAFNPVFHNFYKSEYGHFDTDSANWGIIHLPVFVPSFYDGGKLKVQVWGKGKDVQFKDLEIYKHKQIEDDKQGIHIQIDTTGIIKLKQCRDRAFKQGILIQGDDDWVKGTITSEDKSIPVNIRLKGDWLDHLQGEKWSFRIKVRGDHSWKNMVEFSIQNPHSRSFLNEWLYHKFLLHENILTARYNFTPVYINGIFHGIYAYEEHFRKELLEDKNRREAPILKFNEDGMWEAFNVYGDKQHCINYYEAAEIDVFKIKSIKKSTEMTNYYYQAVNLLKNYREDEIDVSDVFDLEKLAGYVAVSNLFNAHHGFVWHNLRLYFNPFTYTFEPIAFDGYGNVVKPAYPQSIFGFDKNNEKKTILNSEYFVYKIFNNPDFIKAYVTYLKKILSEGYVEHFIEEYKSEMQNNEKLLQEEFPLYSYDYDYLIKSSQILREDLKLYESYLEDQKQTRYEAEEVTSDCENVQPLKNNTLKASSKEEYIQIKTVEVVNYHNEPLELLGTGNYNIQNYFEKVIFLDAYRKPGYVKDITVKGNHKNIFYKVKGTDSVYIEKIKDQIPVVDNDGKLLRSMAKNNSPFFNVSDGQIIFNKGNYVITKPLVINRGYKVIIQEGTTLDFKSGALFYCESPIEVSGSENNKVRIISSDSSARGIYIHAPDGHSVMKHVEIEGIGSFGFNSWSLTGAVTFYRTNIELTNVSFKNNHSEDALNIVNSQYSLNQCHFKNVYSDAFDSDFSEGNIKNCSFNNIGNDAIDCSGSITKISDCKMNLIGDKAVSGGENSKINCEKIKVNNAYISVAAKDLSEVFVVGSDLTNNTYGAIALIKKYEYGPAKIHFKEVKMSNVAKECLIEQNSSFTLDGKKIEGNASDLANIFY